MRLVKTSLVLILIATTACSQKRSDSLFVFVGNIISFDSIKNSDGFASLKYKILEKTYGNYLGDTIDFRAYYDADSLKFTKYKTVLLFLHRSGKNFDKLALPWYHVYQTVDGRWASGAEWWDYTIYPTTIKPKRLQFRDSISFDTKGMDQEQIDHWYPAKYYEVRDGNVKPIFGNYTDELFELNKAGFLHDLKFF
jgi:hypothetical protein